MDDKNVLHTVKSTVSKNSPNILFYTGLCGMAWTVFSATKQTPKVLMAIEKEEKNKYAENGKKTSLTKKEKIKVAWKYYVPTAIGFVFSTACLVSSKHLHIKKEAGLMTAYTVTRNAYEKYRESAKEIVGDKKEKEITNSVAEKKMHEDSVLTNQPIVTGKGESLCYDTWIGRYFYTNYDDVKAAKVEFNNKLTYERYMSYNEWFDELGLSHIRGGDSLGWNIDDGLMEIDFSSQIADDGRPCLVIDYIVEPRGDYMDKYRF